MRQPGTAPAGAEHSAGPVCNAHRVQFYDHDSALIHAVVDFLDAGLTSGSGVVVATPEHRDDVTSMLRAVGWDVPALMRDGQLIMLDASETLEGFLVDDDIDPEAFVRVVGGVLDATARAGGPVRVYGEMVAVLWEQGRVTTAMALEAQWNDLAGTREFDLLCGYPSALFSQPGSASLVEALCEAHTSAVLAPSQLGAHHGAGAAEHGAVVRWHLPADLTSGAVARRRIRSLLRSWELAHLLDETELLVSELVNNAVIHARAEVTVRVSRRPGALRVEVTDSGGGRLRPRDSDLEDTHGRGLMLVDTMSSAWGTAVSEQEKSVWFELEAAPER